MKQNCWGNDTYCWGSEAICVGETPQIQSEGYPDQTRPDQRGYFTLYLKHFPNKFCFTSPTNCVVSPTILLHFPNNFASFTQQLASFPQQYESFPQPIFSFPQQNFVSFCQKKNIFFCNEN